MKSNVCKYVLYAFKSSKIQFMNAELYDRQFQRDPTREA